ncbi:Reverse transcriptase domain, partial [Trinorchestia longiramus]
ERWLCPSFWVLPPTCLQYVCNQSRNRVETRGIPPTSRPPLLPTPVQPKATSRPRPKLNTYRVQLKFIDPNITVERHKMFETTFGELDTLLIRLTDTRTGFYAVTDEANIIDKLTSNKVIEAFKKLNLKPIIPPDLRACRSVFIRQIDYYIGSKNPEEIKEEIQRIQPWLKVSEVIKIKQYTHLLKIVTADITIAQRILTEGFKMFNTKITARQCEQETYTHILICYKCYKFESHTTHECRSTVQVCSECSSPDHLYTQCNSSIKKCINCNGAHRTLAASCPYRREVQKQKKIDEEQNEVRGSNETYATIAKEAVIESSKPKHNITLTSNIQIKLMALIIEAHMASLAQQEGFGTILSKSLKMNYNIDANFLDRDSAVIFKFFYNNQDPTDKTEFTMEPEFMDNDDPRQEHLSLSRTSSENTQPPSPPKNPRLHRHNTTQQEMEIDSMVSTLTKEQKQPRDRSSTREPILLATSNKLKLAIMIFLPKPNTSQHQVQNYIPISLLDVKGKLLDEILNNRLYEQLIVQEKLHPKQHGFRRSRGTHTALATLYETIAIHLSNKDKVDLVMRDISKGWGSNNSRTNKKCTLPTRYGLQLYTSRRPADKTCTKKNQEFISYPNVLIQTVKLILPLIAFSPIGFLDCPLLPQVYTPKSGGESAGRGLSGTANGSCMLICAQNCLYCCPLHGGLISGRHRPGAHCRRHIPPCL